MVKERQKDAKKDVKPLPRPKKFATLSTSDSRRVEARYQKLLEAAEDADDPSIGDAKSGLKSNKRKADGRHSRSTLAKANTRVQVNEDYLFDVDIEQRELEPVYWQGPVYEGEYCDLHYGEDEALECTDTQC